MPAQQIVTKKAPADRKPKSAKPAHSNPLAIDLGEEDAGPQEFPVRFLKDDDVWYDAHLPKGTLALALGEEINGVDTSDLVGMREMIEKFIRLLFKSADVEAIKARLDDPDDRLDLVHIKVLVNRISQRTGGLPTT